MSKQKIIFVKQLIKGFVFAAPLLVLLNVANTATAGPKTTFTGSADGIFTNPSGGVTTGVGTGNFSWGGG